MLHCQSLAGTTVLLLTISSSILIWLRGLISCELGSEPYLVNIFISFSDILWELSQLGRTWHSVRKSVLQHSVGESTFIVVVVGRASDIIKLIHSQCAISGLCEETAITLESLLRVMSWFPLKTSQFVAPTNNSHVNWHTSCNKFQHKSHEPSYLRTFTSCTRASCSYLSLIGDSMVY